MDGSRLPLWRDLLSFRGELGVLLLGNVFTFGFEHHLAVGPWMGSSCVTSGRLLYLSEPWKSPSEPKAMTLLELVKKREDKCRS